MVFLILLSISRVNLSNLLCFEKKNSRPVYCFPGLIISVKLGERWLIVGITKLAFGVAVYPKNV